MSWITELLPNSWIVIYLLKYYILSFHHDLSSLRAGTKFYIYICILAQNEKRVCGIEAIYKGSLLGTCHLIWGLGRSRNGHRVYWTPALNSSPGCSDPYLWNLKWHLLQLQAHKLTVAFDGGHEGLLIMQQTASMVASQGSWFSDIATGPVSSSGSWICWNHHLAT